MYSIQWTIHKHNYIILGMALEPPELVPRAEPEPRPEPHPESKGLSNKMIITIMSVHTIKTR